MSGPNYEVVMIARIVTAIGAGIVTSAASSSKSSSAYPA